jgi:hypothetical protein
MGLGLGFMEVGERTAGSTPNCLGHAEAQQPAAQQAGIVLLIAAVLLCMATCCQAAAQQLSMLQWEAGGWGQRCDRPSAYCCIVLLQAPSRPSLSRAMTSRVCSGCQSSSEQGPAAAAAAAAETAAAAMGSAWSVYILWQWLSLQQV